MLKHLLHQDIGKHSVHGIDTRMTNIEIEKSPICFLHAHHPVHVLYIYLQTPRDVY